MQQPSKTWLKPLQRPGDLPCQGRGRGFESLCPLQLIVCPARTHARNALSSALGNQRFQAEPADCRPSIERAISTTASPRFSAVMIAGSTAEKTSIKASRVKCSFRLDDMRTLKTASAGRYGAIIAMDNALPHLDSDDDILATFAAMRSSLRPGGKVLVSVRDYARHLQERHTCMPPVFYSDNG